MKNYPIALNSSFALLSPFARFKATIYRLLKRPYLIFTLSCYFLIAVVVVLYLQKSPVYKSELELVLPGTGASSNVSIDNIGQVNSQTSAPFSSRGFNPRVNYKEMLLSRRVLFLSSEKTDMTIAEFGQPKIKLTEQTSILTISITGKSGVQASLKAWALYESLQQELKRLRSDEVSLRDVSIQEVLDDYKVKLNQARTNITEFQQRSILVSLAQFELLVASLQSLKEKQIYLHARVKNLANYSHGLSQNLGVSSDLAGKAFTLQSDVEFRGLLKELDESTALLSEYGSRWGKKHPKVIALQLRYNAAKKSLLNRSNEIAGPHASNAFTSLDLQFNPKRAEMFADLIEASALHEGTQAELADLKRAELQLSDQLKLYAREFAVLDRLQKEFYLAEAVFTSAAARIEAGKADVFASYPVIQILTTPSIPGEINSPTTALGLVAGAIGIIFITSGVTILCNRRRLIEALLKRS
jgi:uncharacterized protein involved in exopolysaccharide biosynthesis